MAWEEEFYGVIFSAGDFHGLDHIVVVRSEGRGAIGP